MLTCSKTLSGCFEQQNMDGNSNITTIGFRFRVCFVFILRKIFSFFNILKF